jgi:acyl-CoA thioester hydrolase
MTSAEKADVFTWPVRVYWEDTDAGGVVYYANYLKFMERARTEWLRALGIEQGPLQAQLGVLLVVTGVEVSYRRPAKYGDLLQVTCKIIERGKASVGFEQQIYRGQVGSELIVQAKTKVACIDAQQFKPRPLPKIILGSLIE